MLSSIVERKVKDEKLKKSQHVFITGQKIYYGAEGSLSNLYDVQTVRFDSSETKLYQLIWYKFYQIQRNKFHESNSIITNDKPFCQIISVDCIVSLVLSYCHSNSTISDRHRTFIKFFLWNSVKSYPQRICINSCVSESCKILSNSITVEKS